MRLRGVAPRAGWRERVEGLGFGFHGDGGYWAESEYVELTASDVEAIAGAAAELHRLVLLAVEHVVVEGRLGEVGVPAAAFDLVASSWRAREPSLYGRFDLSFGGDGAPKLLEYNADTPTSLVEGSIVQRDWAEGVARDAAQFNRLEGALTRRWPDVARGRVVHLACVEGSDEDADTISLLAHTASLAGLEPRSSTMGDIGWSEHARRFVDLDDEPIDTLFKLYPWEWLFDEPFAAHLSVSATRFVEPAWKVVPSSKGILPILWQLFRGHPNLLPASFDPSGVGPERVVKPLFSREGANVRIERSDGVIEEPGAYGAEGVIYQGVATLPRWDDWFVVTGAWVVGDEPAGAGFRASRGPITTNRSRFVPHLVV